MRTEGSLGDGPSLASECLIVEPRAWHRPVEALSGKGLTLVALVVCHPLLSFKVLLSSDNSCKVGE